MFLEARPVVTAETRILPTAALLTGDPSSITLKSA